MLPANEHWCPICAQEIVPIWRAMCKNCFDITPWRMRGDFLQAYQRRVLKNREYQERLIEARQWYLRFQEHRREGNE